MEYTGEFLQIVAMQWVATTTVETNPPWKPC